MEMHVCPCQPSVQFVDLNVLSLCKHVPQPCISGFYLSCVLYMMRGRHCNQQHLNMTGL